MASNRMAFIVYRLLICRVQESALKILVRDGKNNLTAPQFRFFFGIFIF